MNAQLALQPLNQDNEPKSKQEYIEDYRRAERAYRQLAMLLRSQGLSEDANNFAYRAQLMQQLVFRRRGKIMTSFHGRQAP